MPRVPYNSVGGFSTGLTMTGVIDSLGNITGVGATFSGLIRANAGISASGATFSGNISAPNIVTSVNGATGSVTTYAGTTGNIQFRYGSGITATNYFDLAEGNLNQITDVLTLSGATVGFDAYYNGNNEALGLQFERGVFGIGMDEGGGVAISAKGIWDDFGYLYGANLYLRTPDSVDSGSNIIFRAAGGNQFTVSPTTVSSDVQHIFSNGIFSYGEGNTNSFGGPITGVTATFTGLLSASKGISASGSISLQNQEFIRNTTNGRMDFMPAPAGSTQFGMYMDFTSWSYGVKLGTIRASDNATNAAGFLWEAPLTINGDVRFNLGSDAQNGFLNSTVGNRTNQFFTNTASGANSGAFAFVDGAGVGAANRSPGVTHTNPNLYVYRSGSARATDFIRMEHDGTNGRIVSGGTSGIKLEPGSGSVGISGSMSSVDGTFAGSVYTDSIYDINGILNLNNKANTRVAIGDYGQNLNSTYIYLRDNVSTLHISNPFGAISLGDPGSIDNANYIYYDAANAIFSGNFTSSLEGFQTISADVSILENNRRVTTNARSWFL